MYLREMEVPMRKEPVEVERETLYEQVWSTPMIQLAKQYGLSDRGLAKVCQRLHVPVPGRGYWARLQHGYSTRRPALPALAPGHQDVWEHDLSKAPTPEDDQEQDVRELLAYELDPLNVIEVPERLGRSHELVIRTRKSLREAGQGGRTLLHPSGARVFDICVSKRAMPRALRILDSLVKALEDRGFTIECRHDERLQTSVALLGEKVRIRLEELQDRSEIKRRSSWNTTYSDYEYAPNGNLALRILDLDWSGLRQNWRDGKRRNVETCLNAFVIGIVNAAAHERTRRREHEQRQREWLEQERRREEEQARRRLEEERISALNERLAARRKSEEVHTFMSALSRDPLHQDLVHSGQAWNEWIARYRERLEEFWRSVPPGFEARSEEA
jgi:hypothetical protein